MENNVKGNIGRNSVTQLAGGMQSQFHNTIMSVRVGLKTLSLGITVCHHSASLVMLNRDPLGGFFNPILAKNEFFSHTVSPV